MIGLARLLHIADSAFPVGSFAYSFGLEAAIALRGVTNATHLTHHIYGYLKQTATFELPFAQAVFQTSKACAVEQLLVYYDCMQLVPSVKKASQAQGRNWIQTLSALYPESTLADMEKQLRENNLPFHFTVVFAQCLKVLRFRQEEVLIILLHFALRDQLSAALRLGLVGPTESHRLQHNFYHIFEGLLEKMPSSQSLAYRSSFLLDVFQMQHEQLRTKLFQN